MRNLTLIILLTILSSCNGHTKKLNEELSKSDNFSSSEIKSPVVTIDGVVYFSVNNGLTWESKSEGLPDSINIALGGIAVSDKSLGIATKEKGIFLFDFQKNLWINITTDKKIIESNLGPLIFFKDQIYVGTQTSGVFSSAYLGENWTKLNTGLANFTIRKFVHIDDKLYAGTNAGLYSFNEFGKKWELEYGNSTMQVNGLTEFDGKIYIGTNQGAFTTPKDRKEWIQIMANRTLHNISSDDNTIYAMTYNELLSSTDKGLTWKNIQNGLPAELYTFNVIKNGNSVFAGQWDGVYRKDNANEIWKSYSNGLPEKFAINNMKLYKGTIVVSGSERRLKRGMNTDKNEFK
jgi:photosystem II stability/assembly factor-like uncharacterized protein